MTTARIPPERSEPSADDAVARLMELRLAGDKVLVIVSARPQQLGRLGDGWTRFLTGDRRCSRLTLARLSAGELAELAAASGRSALSGRALRRVADHSGGNPLFARAMLTELPDDVLEGPDDGLYLPRSLAAVILPGLEALPAAVRSLVVAASVLGECAVSDAPSWPACRSQITHSTRRWRPASWSPCPITAGCTSPTN